MENPAGKGDGDVRRENRFRRLALWLFVGISLIVGGTLYFGAERGSDVESRPTIARQATIPVSRGAIARTISTTGQLDPFQDETLTFNVTGIVTDVLVTEGQRVKEGDVIARIDDTAARLQHLRASSEYETALLSASTLIIEERRLELELAEKSLEGVILKAPFDAVVAEVNMKVGDSVGQEARSDAPSIHLVDLSTYKIEVAVDQSDLRHVQAGQDVEVRIDTYPGLTLPGHVQRVALLPLPGDSVVLYPVKVVLDMTYIESSSELHPGLTAHVDIVIEKAEDALVVPVASVVETGRQTLVTRVDEGGVQEVVAVETGISDGLQVEIRSGLREGEHVLINNYELYRTLLGEGGGASGPGVRGGGSGSRGSTQIRLPLGGVIRR